MKWNFTRYEEMILKIIQIILGLLFVISGWVKAVDPMGVSLKIEEYLYSFNLEALIPMSDVFATMLCAAEIFIGIMLLCGIYKKIISILTLLFILGFTIVTFYLVLNPGEEIQECGCFGDAIHLTNNETFAKNIIFLILIIIYLWRQIIKPIDPNSNKWIDKGLKSSKVAIIITIYVAVISLFVPIYSFIFLPPFDYLPFNRGENLLENINNVSDNSAQVEVKLIYKNKKSGEIKKFPLSDDSWQDATLWEYVDTETSGDEGTLTDYMSKFAVYDKQGEDVTLEVLDNSNEYTFILIAGQIENLDNEDLKKLDNLHKLHREQTVKLHVFSSSDIEKVGELLSKNGWYDVNAYSVDQVVLKSMIRDKKGVMMLNNGVVAGKWNLKHDSLDDISKGGLTKLVKSEKLVKVKFFLIITFILVLLGWFMNLYRNLKRKECERGSN